jgi:hypothetical protein
MVGMGAADRLAQVPDERVRCACGGFTSTRPDGSQWGWHKGECPRLELMYAVNERVWRGEMGRASLLSRLDDAVLDHPPADAREGIVWWKFYGTTLLVIGACVLCWYLFLGWLLSL